MNQQNLIIMGRSTQESQQITSKGGKDFLTFNVAVNEYRGKEVGEVANFYEVLCFGKQPKQNAKKVSKGDVVLVVGRPDASAYETNDGELVAQMKVVADHIRVYNPPDFIRNSEAEQSESEEE